MFSIGQKIVCIDDDFSKLKAVSVLSSINVPKKGRVYTVRDITELGLLLVEVKNKEFVFEAHNNLVSEPRFAFQRFVPLKNDFQKIEFSRVIEAVETSAN